MRRVRARRERPARAAARAAARTRAQLSAASSARITPRLPDSAERLDDAGIATAIVRGLGSAVGERRGTTAPAGPPRRSRSRVELVRARAAAASGGCPGSPRPRPTRAASHHRPIADREHAVDRPRRARRRRIAATDRPLRGTGPEWRRPARDRRADGTDRWRRQIDAEPRGRFTERAQSDSRSSSTEENSGHECAALGSDQSHLLCGGLGSTVPGLVEVRHRPAGARAARRRRRGRRASCARRHTSREHLLPRGAPAGADQRRDVGLQPSTPDPRAPTGGVSDAPSNGRVTARTSASSSIREPFRNQQPDRELNGRHVLDQAEASIVAQQLDVAAERRPRRERDEGRRERQAEPRDSARRPRRSPRACVPSRAARARRRRTTRPRWSRTRSRCRAAAAEGRDAAAGARP